jgi:hypothetical protein
MICGFDSRTDHTNKRQMGTIIFIAWAASIAFAVYLVGVNKSADKVERNLTREIQAKDERIASLEEYIKECHSIR